MDIGSSMPMPYLVDLVVLFVSIGVIYLVYKFKSSVGPAARRNLPPGKKGLPYIGESLDYMLALRHGVPDKFINNRMTKYSPDVFRTSLLGEDIATFCGAAGNKFIFTSQSKFTTWWPKSIDKVLAKPTGANGDYSLNQVFETGKRYLERFLKPASLQNYVPVMDVMAKEHLDQDWSPNEQVLVFHLSKKYTLALSFRLVMGIRDQEFVERLSNPFAIVSAGIISMPIDLPGTAYNRAIKASKQIRQELLALITKRKKELKEKGETAASDFLDSMIMDGITEVEISDWILGFIFASQETTSSALTFLISYLADYPDIYKKVLEEHMAILRSKKPDQALRREDVQKMKYTWSVACEAMRLRPPSNGGFRETAVDFTFAGYTIPKGWKAFWTVHSTHKNPKYFPDPEKFDPSRFEGKGPAPFTFVPFGAGPKMCPGKEFARLLILTFIHNLITKYKWEKLNPNEKIFYFHVAIPKEGLPMKIQPITVN